MAVFDVNANQVLAQPVSGFYQGKALRAGIRGQELQNQALEDEIENAPATRATAMRKAALDEANILQQMKKRAQEIGLEETKRMANAYGPILEKYEAIAESDGDDAALEFANKEIPLAVRSLGEEHVADFQAVKGEDGVLSHEEIARLGFAVKPYYDKEAAEKKSQHQQHIDALVESGTISRQEGNQLLKRIEEKAGTIVGRTPEDVSSDPRTSSQIGADHQKNLNEANSSSELNELIGTTLPKIAALPKTVGATGKIALGGAGLMSALGQQEMAETFAKFMAGADQETIASMQTSLQVIRGQITAIITGEESTRLSETEREIASTAVGLIDKIQGPADLTKAYPQVVGALKQLYEESWVRQYNVSMKDPAIPVPYDLNTKDGRTGLLTEFSTAGIDADSAKRAVIRLMAIQGAEY